MKRQRGFSLTFVIVALILVGIGMFALGAGSNVMLFYADRTYVRALERNLTASGLAWAWAKAGDDPNLSAGGSVELDVAAFGPSAVRLSVRILDAQDGRARVRIETTCVKRERAFNAASEHSLAVRCAARARFATSRPSPRAGAPCRW